MMMQVERKAISAAFKERKQRAGIFLIRCPLSDGLWVGRSRDLTSAPNRMWFMLRHGPRQPLSLDRAWRDHGADGFNFEIVEELDEEETAAPNLDRRLRERLAGWVERLGAVAI